MSVNDGLTQRIGDVLIETFSYTPQHSLKYVLENEKEIEKDLSQFEANPEAQTTKSKSKLENEEANTDEHLPQESKDTENQDVTETVQETTVSNNEEDETKIVEIETYPDEEIIKLLSRSKRQADELSAADKLVDPLVNISDNKADLEAEKNISETNSLGPKSENNVTGPIKVLGLRVEESAKEPHIVDEMIPSVLRETHFTLRLFGENLSDETIIAFTHAPSQYGRACDHLLTGEYQVCTQYYFLYLIPIK